MKTTWAAAAVLLAFCGGAASARADGLPVLGIDVGSTGVASLAGNARYVTIPVGRNTLVERIAPHGGRVLWSRLLRGMYTIPAVAYDGSASGLSADGRRLVLIEPRRSFPRSETGLAVLDTRSLRPLLRISLKGDFSFDAVSARGGLLYLIQYVSPIDPTRYLVRAFDVRADRLFTKPVVDPREPGDKMRGSPLTRAMSADGRWAYTLYDGGGSMPFVHALDTRNRTARCIDLDSLAHTNLGGLTLRVDGSRGDLTVARAGSPIVRIDTRTFAVSAAGVDGAGFPWLTAVLSALGVTVVLVALSLGLRRRRLPALAH